LPIKNLTGSPTLGTKTPTKLPTKAPTKLPTKTPTKLLTEASTGLSTDNPSGSPTLTETGIPTHYSSGSSTEAPTELPSQAQTKNPTGSPTVIKTERPTLKFTESNQTPLKLQTQSPIGPLKSQPPDPTGSPVLKQTKSQIQRLTKVPTQIPTAPHKLPPVNTTTTPTDTTTKSLTQVPSESSKSSESELISCTFMRDPIKISKQQCEINDKTTEFKYKGVSRVCGDLVNSSSAFNCKFWKIRAHCPITCSCKTIFSLELCEDDDRFSVDDKTCQDLSESDCKCEVGNGILIEDHCPKKCNTCDKETSVCKIIDYEASHDCASARDNPKLCKNNFFKSDCLVSCSCI